MDIDSEVKFTRVFKGYSPQEVDAVFEEMRDQIDDLAEDNRGLSETILLYNQRLRQLEAMTQCIVDERARECRVMDGVLQQAVRVAKDITQEARNQADEMIWSAQIEAESLREKAQQDAMVAWSALMNASLDLNNVREANQRLHDQTGLMLDELNSLIDKALGDIDSPSDPEPAPSPDAPVSAAQPQDGQPPIAPQPQGGQPSPAPQPVAAPVLPQWYPAWQAADPDFHEGLE